MLTQVKREGGLLAPYPLVLLFLLYKVLLSTLFPVILINKIVLIVLYLTLLLYKAY